MSAVVTGPDGPHALRLPTRFLMHVPHSLIPAGRAGSLRGGSHAPVHGCSVPVVRGTGTGLHSDEAGLLGGEVDVGGGLAGGLITAALALLIRPEARASAAAVRAPVIPAE